MKKLKKAYKIEIKPTKEQIVKIHQTIGVSRFIYNFYIAHNKEVYEKDKNFVKADDIRKQLADMGVVLEDTPQGTTWRRA